MKNFSFGVFNYKTKLFKQISQYIVTTEETTVRDVKRVALRDKKTIIYKWNDRNRDFKIQFSRI